MNTDISDLALILTTPSKVKSMRVEYAAVRDLAHF